MRFELNFYKDGTLVPKTSTSFDMPEDTLIDFFEPIRIPLEHVEFNKNYNGYIPNKQAKIYKNSINVAELSEDLAEISADVLKKSGVGTLHLYYSQRGEFNTRKGYKSDNPVLLIEIMDYESPIYRKANRDEDPNFVYLDNRTVELPLLLKEITLNDYPYFVSSYIPKFANRINDYVLNGQRNRGYKNYIYASFKSNVISNRFDNAFEIKRHCNFSH